jgi:hypothetical protein
MVNDAPGGVGKRTRLSVVFRDVALRERGGQARRLKD